MPPPLVAVLPEIVELEMEAVPLCVRPPVKNAVLFEIVELVMVRVPWL